MSCTACVEQVELLAGQLVDAVDVDRRRRVVLVDGQVPRPAVHLAGRRLHDGARRVRRRAPISRNARWLRTLRSRSRKRILHRGEVADLTGDVEDDVGALERAGHLGASMSRLEHVHVEARQVGAIAAVLGHQRVDDDVRTAADELVHEVRTDEAEAAGDDAPRAGKRG